MTEDHDPVPWQVLSSAVDLLVVAPLRSFFSECFGRTEHCSENKGGRQNSRCPYSDRRSGRGR